MPFLPTTANPVASHRKPTPNGRQLFAVQRDASARVALSRLSVAEFTSGELLGKIACPAPLSTGTSASTLCRLSSLARSVECEFGTSVSSVPAITSMGDEPLLTSRVGDASARAFSISAGVSLPTSPAKARDRILVRNSDASTSSIGPLIATAVLTLLLKRSRSPSRFARVSHAANTAARWPPALMPTAPIRSGSMLYSVDVGT